ncbi:hypothetical protein OG875_12255 [Streptomyces sp. NBC_01498]|uniref:hypothetical protein n=1 Tax=Streptomyces sp. NBC_01498 TaxID=2975870 RepID=UPI002E7B532B|nr:hypothetical protein [Streptomyces sp. NBC_01498]WTL25290.1 hypothetical protein OG875_12255 [Streptomyces sp. NBC_01498]
MKTQQTADALSAKLRQHRLHIPGLAARQDSIVLGDVTVTTADHLALLLGAPAQQVQRNLDQWPEAQQLMRRLGAAFRTVTGGGFLDLYFHHDCVRCDSDAALTLGPIGPREAELLLSAIQTREATTQHPPTTRSTHARRSDD